MALLAGVGLAAGVTWLFVITGIDWAYCRYFAERPWLVMAAVPGVLAGMVVPVLIIAIAWLRGHRALARDAFMALVAAFLISTLLKAFSSRVDMEPFEPLGAVDFSGLFRIGWLRGANIWESLAEGWPSGHTLTTVAMAVRMHPHWQGRRARVASVLYAIWIPLSVSTAFHWLSDVMAGAILGLLVGWWWRRQAMAA